jgi:hypothetical protein
MQLIYRGNAYSYNPADVHRSPQVAAKAAYTLIYRGCTYQIDPSTTTGTSVRPATYKLIYRGSSYRVTRNQQGGGTAIAFS